MQARDPVWAVAIVTARRLGLKARRVKDYTVVISSGYREGLVGL